MKPLTTNRETDGKVPRYVLPIIIFAQFAGTSLWFAGNAIATDLIGVYGLPKGSVGYLTSSVQLGFITGTLVFAFFALADRISPVRLFTISSFLAASFNLSILVVDDLILLLAARFATGFFLAGIYPIGMKISSDWYGKRLGKALGFLVGALVLGTALPHLLKATTQGLPWERVIIATSVIASIGGLLLGLVLKDGPNRKLSTGFDPSAILKIFRFVEFRRAAFGYFGHMWELYAMWAFVPVILSSHESNLSGYQISIGSFAIIALGAIGCVTGGFLSLRTGSSKVAFWAMILSGLCCLSSPFLADLPIYIFLSILFIWGFSVVADSPQFSTIVARTAPPEYIGSALTIVNSIGFAITIPSIELLNATIGTTNWAYLILFIGPLFGIISIYPLSRKGI